MSVIKKKNFISQDMVCIIAIAITTSCSNELSRGYGVLFVM